ncbi:hypothetical protein [Pararhizobium qamdonense]|uniref:hypothetical protein n=1 Tax=Pararhizobium qamdonense TaxID=3031126 RepID=UPI0023E197F5|nr:hypothetical protein [Pararhizobium qamdonense]
MTKTVMATRAGTYGHYREEGAVFQIDTEKHFSKNWMVEITSAQAKKLQAAAQLEPEAERHVVDTSVVDNAELEALRVQLAESQAENERLKRSKKPKPEGTDTSANEQPKSAAEVLAMATDPNVQFMSFKSAATKLLGEGTPANKAEIIAALEDLATKP